MTTPSPMQVVMARRKLATCNPRQIRKTAGLTQEEMGELVGVGASAMSRLEAGNRQPGSAVAVRWAAILAQLQADGAVYDHAIAA
jgi:DNA-binding XRE family transcriptional regulator